jgi:hypothetical protein
MNRIQLNMSNQENHGLTGPSCITKYGRLFHRAAAGVWVGMRHRQHQRRKLFALHIFITNSPTRDFFECGLHIFIPWQRQSEIAKAWLMGFAVLMSDVWLVTI